MSARELMLDYSLHILAIYKFPLKIADFIDASFFCSLFPSLGRSLYEAKKKKILFPSWIWLKAGTRKWQGYEIASASNLKLLESGNAFSTIYTLSVGTAHDMACWGRLTCKMFPLLNFQPKHTYFLITIWGVFAEMAVHHVLSILEAENSFVCSFVRRRENSFQTRTKNINDKNWVVKWDWTNKNGTKWVYSHEHCGTRSTYTISNAHRRYHHTLYLAFYFIITCSFL